VLTLFEKIKKSQEGTLILMSLLVLSSILATSALIGALVVRDIRFSTDMENGVLAFYASETAFEEALFEIRKNNTDPLTLNNTSGNLSNNAVWNRKVSDRIQKFFFDLIPLGNSISVDVYDETVAGDAAGVASFRFGWSSGSRMQVIVNEWDGSNLTAVSNNTHICNAKPCADIIVSNLDASKAYSVTIRALGDDISNFTAISFSSLFPSTGSEKLIRTPVTINTIGDFSTAKQASEITIAKKRPWD
jgi:hypothetical protein